MSYEERRKDFSREHFYIVELELDFCTRTYGVAPCTASIPATGETECYNTRFSCQDPNNYQNTTGKVYRFCTQRSELPEGLNAIPSIIGDPATSPTQVEVDGGLGVRAQVTVNFDDHPDFDLDSDPYVLVRTGGAATEGTYWGRLRARNPFHINRRMRVFSGYLIGGVYDPENFEERLYLIEDITLNRGRATVKAKDPLKRTESGRAEYPIKKNGTLAADITAAATQLTLNPVGIVAAEYPASGWIRIGNEIIRYGVLAGDTLNLFDRGEFNTQAADHSLGDNAQLCWRYSGTVDGAVSLLLTAGAGIPFDLQDLAGWQSERSAWFDWSITGIVTEPTKVNDLLKELSDVAPHYLFWDERAQLVRMVAIKPPPQNANVYNEQDHILADSFRVKEMPDMRISQVQINYGLFDPTQNLSEFSNYRVSYNRINAEREGSDQYDQSKFKRIDTRWLGVADEVTIRSIASTLGRRFGITPRRFTWRMDPKDGDIWTGDTVILNSRETPDLSGAPGNVFAQVISAKEIRGRFEYEALEYVYDDELITDPDPDTQTIQISGRLEIFNFRDAWVAVYGTPTALSKPRLEITPSGEIGNFETGAWPEIGAQPLLFRVFPGGRIQGRGGVNGFGGFGVGQGGFTALNMNHAVEFEPMDGVLAGGGGGGGGAGGAPFVATGGGGGAGIPPGRGFLGGVTDGGIDTGGRGVTASGGTGGNGGDRGQPGANGSGFQPGNGGPAGAGIVRNGNALTWQRGSDSAKVEGGILP